MMLTLILAALTQEVLGTASKEWSQAISAIDCSPDGKSLVTARRSGEVVLWDLETRQPLRTLLDPSKESAERFSMGSRQIDAVSYTPDGKFVAAVGFRFGLRLWDAATGAALWKEEDARGTLAVSPDGKTLLTVKGFKGEVDLWDLESRKHLATIKPHLLSVLSLAFSRDGKSVFSCSPDLTVRKWDLASRKELWRLGKETEEMSIGPTFPQRLRLSPDGKQLAVTYHGCWFLKGEIVDPDSGLVRQELKIGHSDGLAFKARENVLAFQGEEHLVLYDTAARKPKSKSQELVKDRIFGMAFTPDGRRLLTTREDGRLSIWDLSGFQPPGND